MSTEAPERPTKASSSPAGRRRQTRVAKKAEAEDRFRHKILPRSVIGIVTLLLAGAIGFAFGGTVLYAYYQFKLDKVEERVDDFIRGFEGRRQDAIDEIAKESETGQEEIRRELEPLQALTATGETLKKLVDGVKDSVYLVETQDEFGQPKVGSAFVVTSDAEKSYLVTSLSVVRASTNRPGPAIVLRQGDERFGATLHTWHDERDLALLIVDKGSLPRVKWAPAGDPPDFGQRVFIVGGIGGAGASITQGLVADVSAAGVQHDAAASGPFAGGPLLNAKGEAVGVATPAYAPLGFTSDRITFAPLIRAACEQILKCPEGATSAGGAGERR